MGYYAKTGKPSYLGSSGWSDCSGLCTADVTDESPERSLSNKVGGRLSVWPAIVYSYPFVLVPVSILSLRRSVQEDRLQVLMV